MGGIVIDHVIKNPQNCIQLKISTSALKDSHLCCYHSNSHMSIKGTFCSSSSASCSQVTVCCVTEFRCGCYVSGCEAAVTCGEVYFHSEGSVLPGTMDQLPLHHHHHRHHHLHLLHDNSIKGRHNNYTKLS